MPSVLLLSSPSRAADILRADLEAAGVELRGSSTPEQVVQDVIRLQPDVLVCQAARADALVPVLQVLHEHAPLPVVLHTADVDATHLEQCLAAGVQEFLFGPHDPKRLRPTLQLAQARFRQQQTLREQLGAVSQRFEERKLVDRAKGILMAMRGLSESDAFLVLRTASMQGAMRMGEAAKAVIDGARQAADVNRSGQLRMLSQRVVKLQALLLAGTAVPEARALKAQSLALVEERVAALRQELSTATFGDLLEGLVRAWTRMKSAAAGPLTAAGMLQLDEAAESLLQKSEALTAALEHAGSGSSLHVVNLAGRQRMLSQRCAKLALLGAPPDALAQACEAFTTGLKTLEALPLTSAELARSLQQVRAHWQQLHAALGDVGTASARQTIAASSEALLDELDALTDGYQRSLQVLLG